MTEPAGADTVVTAQMAGRDAVARMRTDADVKPGQTVELSIDMERAVPFDPNTEDRIA